MPSNQGQDAGQLLSEMAPPGQQANSIRQRYQRLMGNSNVPVGDAIGGVPINQQQVGGGVNENYSSIREAELR